MIISYLISALISFGVYFLMSFVFLWGFPSVPDFIEGIIHVIAAATAFSIALVNIHHVPNGNEKRKFRKAYEENPEKYTFVSDLMMLLKREKKFLVCMPVVSIITHVVLRILTVTLSPTSLLYSVLHLALFPFNVVFAAIDHPILIDEMIVCCALNIVVLCGVYILCLGACRKRWQEERK